MEQPLTCRRSFNSAPKDTNFAQAVRLSASLHLHYVSALSEHLLRTELSQIFSPILGAPHGTSFERPQLPPILLGLRRNLAQ
jgi:hypothetical protein